MTITGTHFNYYLICHRKLWLFANGFQMEHTSDLVYEGSLIHETTYTHRPEKFKEIEINGVKVDFYDPKEQVIHEVKKSDSHEEAHEWQLKYYIFVLQNAGIDCRYGLLEYPRLRITREVVLSDPDRLTIQTYRRHINSIVENSRCPKTIARSKCKNCSYYDFCWAGESDLE